MPGSTSARLIAGLHDRVVEFVAGLVIKMRIAAGVRPGPPLQRAGVDLGVRCAARSAAPIAGGEFAQIGRIGLAMAGLRLDMRGRESLPG